MQRLGCKSFCVCVCECVRTLLYVCGYGCALCVRSHCACVCSTPERLSSLSSETTGVQSVCFHTPLLRYNGSHFCLPSFSAFCASYFSSSPASSLSFCLFSLSLLLFLFVPPHPHPFLTSTPAGV